MLKNEVVRRVWQTLEPQLAEQGYELVEVEYAREHAGWTLRLYIDQENGITLDDCQAASQLVSPVLDAEDIVEGHYMLEVSSPGFDRPLRKPVDFERFAGERVKVTAHTPVGGRKKFVGTLKGCHDGMVAMDCDGTACAIHIENVKKARLDR